MLFFNPRIALLPLAALPLAGLVSYLAAEPSHGSTTATQSPERDPSTERPRAYYTIARKSLSDYVRTADTIVVATVVAVSHEFIEDVGQSTLYHLSINETIKGSPAALIAVVVDATGGQDPLRSFQQDRGLDVSDEGVFFLQRSAELGTYGVLGLSGGLYRVDTSSAGERVVSGLHAPALENLDLFAERLRSIHALAVPSKR